MISVLRRSFLPALAMMTLVMGPLAASAQSELPVIRAAMLKIGTVNWELDTITRNGFDVANGFRLEMQPYADNGATRVAVAGGEADMFVADWIWVAQQRAEGRDYVFIPYSKAVGGLVVSKDSPAKTLADLAGLKIGIAGGPVDKSWLILQAYAKQQYGMDLAASTEQVYGAPPLIMKAAFSGEVDGAINFWHFLAKMKAGGMRQLISVEEATVALGLDPEVPLLGYVLRESFIAENPGIAKALYSASRNAKDLLGSDDAAWDDIRPQMNAKNDAQFETLREDFRAGIPNPGSVNAESAGQLLQLMAELGGEQLVGRATTLPEGLFVNLD
jgi:NitT/TauT family transport system substrate-binding protein